MMVCTQTYLLCEFSFDFVGEDRTNGLHTWNKKGQRVNYKKWIVYQATEAKKLKCFVVFSFFLLRFILLLFHSCCLSFLFFSLLFSLFFLFFLNRSHKMSCLASKRKKEIDKLINLLFFFFCLSFLFPVLFSFC